MNKVTTKPQQRLKIQSSKIYPKKIINKFEYINEIKLDQAFLSKLIKDRYSRLNLTNKQVANKFFEILSK